MRYIGIQAPEGYFWGYAEKDLGVCAEMTVKELKAWLDARPDDKEVYVEVEHWYPDDENLEVVFLEVFDEEDKLVRLRIYGTCGEETNAL